MTWSYTGTLTSNATATITSAGFSFGPITKSTAGTTLTLADNFTSTGLFTWNAGTLDFTDKTVTLLAVEASNTGVKSIVFGTSGLLNLTGTGTVWNQLSGNNSITSSGSRNVRVTSTGSTAITVSVGGATTATCLNWSWTGGTYALNAAGQFRNMDFTGYSGAIGQGNTRSIFGDLTLSSTCTISSGTGNTFNGTGIQTIRSNGRTVDIPITQNGSGGTLRLLDSLTMGSLRTFTLTNGTLDLNGNTLTVGSTGSFTTATGTKNITFNGGILVCPAATVTAFNNAQPTNFTTTAGTGTGEIRLTAATAKTFVGGGSTYNCTLSNNGAGALTITGSNTFTTLANGVQPTTFTFTAGTTTTVTNWSVSGTAGNLVTINSATAAAHTLSKASGTVSADYLSITNSTATGGATWYAGANSTDVSGNTGWIFTAPPSGNLAGSLTVTFSTTAVAAGTGKLSGVSDITATLSGTLVGAGVLTGSSDPTFSLSGTLTTAGGNLAGSSDVTFSTSGTAVGDGALAGSSDPAFSLSGTLTAAAGNLVGSVTVTFTTDSTLSATASAVGSTDLTFTATATPFAPTPPTPTPTPSRNVGGTLYALPMEDPLDKVRERDEKELVEIIGILVTMGVFHGDV
jgi:hypothetical protein